MFLHWQDRVLERAGGSPAADRTFFMPNKADVYVAALHRWLNSNGGEPFAGELLPERQHVSLVVISDACYHLAQMLVLLVPR